MSKKPFHLEKLAFADAIHVSWGVCMLCHRAHHVLSSLPHPPGHHLGWSIPVWFMLVSFWCIPMFYLNFGSNAGWTLSYIAIMKEIIPYLTPDKCPVSFLALKKFSFPI